MKQENEKRYDSHQKIVDEFSKLVNKTKVRGFWICTDYGDSYYFNDIVAKNMFILAAKVEEKILENELENMSLSKLGKIDKSKNKEIPDYVK